MSYSFDINHLPFPSVVLNVQGHFIKANPPFCDILGYSEYEYQALSIYDVMPPKSGDLCKKELQGALVAPKARPQASVFFTHKSGYMVPCLFGAVALRGANSEVLYVAQIFMETSAEPVLNFVRNYTLTNELVIESVFVVNEKCEVIGMNASAERMSCLSKEEIAAQPLFAECLTFVDEAGKKITSPVATSMRTSRPMKFHETVLPKHGAMIQVAGNITPIKYPNAGEAAVLPPFGAIIVCVNELERRAMEERLREMHLMNSIGAMAHGISIEFRNTLGGIMGSAELLNKTLSERAETRPDVATGAFQDNFQDCTEYANTIMASCKRATALVGQMISVSHPDASSYNPVAVDIHQAIREALALLVYVMVVGSKRIEMKQRLDASLSYVEGDIGIIQNTIINLALHARDAMPGGGRITISTSNRTFSEDAANDLEQFHVKPELKTMYLELQMTDSSPGMDVAELAHIFTPSFESLSVRKLSEPRGSAPAAHVGLTTVLRAVKQMKGALAVSSERGSGTTFSIFLRLARTAQPPMPGPLPEGVPAPRAAVVQIPKRQGTIMIVDDDMVMLKVGKQMLKKMGFDVILAHDGLEGVELYRTMHDKISLVLLDMVMPRMSGGEALLHFQKINPKVKVVISSGCLIGEEIQAAREVGVQYMLTKPYKFADLERSVSESLGLAPPQTPPLQNIRTPPWKPAVASAPKGPGGAGERGLQSVVLDRPSGLGSLGGMGSGVGGGLGAIAEEDENEAEEEDS